MLDGDGRRFTFCSGAPAKACPQAPGFLARLEVKNSKLWAQ